MIRGGVLRAGGYGLSMLATVGSGAVVIRHLGLIDTGHFTTVTALVTIVATVSDLGLTGFAVREYAAGHSTDRQQFLRNLLGIRLAIASTGLAAAVLFGLLVGYPAVMVLGTVVAGAGMMAFVAQDACAIPLQAGLRFGWVATFQLVIQVGVAIEAVLLAVAGAGLLPFFALQVPVVIPVLIATMVVGGRDARLRPAFALHEWRQMVGRILPYSAAVVLAVVYFQIAQVMVSVLSSSAQTGYFGVAFRMLLAFTTLPPLLVSTALPVLARAARDDAERFEYASRRLVETMLIVGAGVALALSLGASFAVRLIAGAGFGHAIAVLQILAFALLGTFVISARGYALLSLDRLRAMMISNAVALGVVVVGGVVLINAYAANGAAIAMLAAELTLALCYELSLRRARGDLGMGLGFILRVAVAMAIAAGAATAVDVSSLADAALGVVIYIAALAAFGSIPAEIRAAIFRHHDPAP